MEKDSIPLPEAIGHYKCIKRIGRGGMGEVILAYDPLCDREVAIKRIRPDLKKHPALKNRFLREAKITAQLTHPGIISIYTIHQENDEIYYTMPYIPGNTLRQLLRNAHQKFQKVQGPDTIAALLPIFKNICQTVSYAHSKGILHRDLKPENILVGTFGEVIVFDWGLAQLISEPPQEIEEIEEENQGKISADLTRPGKLVGTVAFMAPERALGQPATVQTEIYALGVILYQILTLQLPFIRTSIKEFRKIYKHEKLVDPEEIAPYRDVPPRLSRIVKKCLDSDPEKRYQTTEALNADLMSHMEGRSEWFETARLNIAVKKDWEFQENLLISKHLAITRMTESADWVSIMVSKAAFSENTRLQTSVYIGETGAGIGFLLSVPELTERENPIEGYCLWLGSERMPGAQLFRNTIEVMALSDFFLKRNSWHLITIEKIGNNIHFSLNGIHYLTYLSYLPLLGTHIGILSRDADFQMDEIVVSVGNQNLQISCLAIPDAFLAGKDYKRAIAEYRRIGYSFPGHAEGREALFRAGITLLEQAKNSRKQAETEEFFSLALEEFGKLHLTPGAPLEYLGKALVYQALRDDAEEIKCLELGLRRYSRHPLVYAIKEQIVYRMHEATQTNRLAAYRLIFIALRFLPEVVQSGDFKRLFKHLIKNWEPLYFLESFLDFSLLGQEKIYEIHFSIPLAFWLAAPYMLMEIYQELSKFKSFDAAAFGDLLYALFELGAYDAAQQLLKEAQEFKTKLPLPEAQELQHILQLLEPLDILHSKSLEAAITSYLDLRQEEVGVRQFRTICHLMQYALQHQQEEKVHTLAKLLSYKVLGKEEQIYLDAFQIWAFLNQNLWEEAAAIFDQYPIELLNQESTLLHPLFGCYLYATEGEEIAMIHFSGVIDTPFPRSWALLGHELTNKISESSAWYSRSFLWERRRLYQQLTLFYHCSQNPELEAYYRYLEQKEYLKF